MLYESIGNGRVIVQSTGYPVSLVGIGTIANRVDIQAINTNVGDIVIGSSNVKTDLSEGGMVLSPGDIYSVELVSDLIRIFVNGASGDGVTFVYWQGNSV